MPSSQIKSRECCTEIFRDFFPKRNQFKVYPLPKNEKLFTACALKNVGANEMTETCLRLTGRYTKPLVPIDDGYFW